MALTLHVETRCITRDHTDITLQHCSKGGARDESVLLHMQAICPCTACSMPTSMHSDKGQTLGCELSVLTPRLQVHWHQYGCFHCTAHVNCAVKYMLLWARLAKFELHALHTIPCPITCHAAIPPCSPLSVSITLRNLCNHCMDRPQSMSRCC